MKNVLMQVCRTMHNYTDKQIAAKLGITHNEYLELETSTVAMTPAQAERLSAIYNIEAEHFLESSRQLELLLTRAEVIKQLQSENKYQQSELERLRNFVFVHKELFLDGKAENETEENDKNVDHEQETLHQ